MAPQIAPFSFGQEPVNAGDMASVQCAVTKGDSPIKISWLFENSLIDRSRIDIVMLDIGKQAKQLMIESVRAKHAGTYTCVAENFAGTTTRSALLAVNGTLLLLSYVHHFYYRYFTPNALPYYLYDYYTIIFLILHFNLSLE